MEKDFLFFSVTEYTLKDKNQKDVKYQKIILFDSVSMDKVSIVKKEKNKFDLTGIKKDDTVYVGFDVGIYNKDFYLKIVSLRKED